MASCSLQGHKELDTTEHSAALRIFVCFLDFFCVCVCVDILKVLIEFVAILVLFYVLIFGPRDMWDQEVPTNSLKEVSIRKTF